MKSEYTYLGFFMGIITLIVLIFDKLLQKYTYLTLSHFAETCSQSLTRFFSSGYDLVGLFILLLVLGLVGYLFLKVIFSTIKTHRRKAHFASTQVTVLPRQIKKLCIKQGLDVQNILVVKNNQPQAFTLGLLSQKIVITTGLIKTLTKEELEAVLFHEQYHVNGYHSLLILICQVISSGFFFLPFLQDVFTLMKAEFEYQADDFAKQMQSTHEHVISAITKLVSSDLNPDLTPAFAIGTVEKRIAKLEGKEVSSFSFSLQKWLFTMIMTVFLYGLFTFPVGAHFSEEANFGNTQCNMEMKCTVYCENGFTFSSSESVSQMFSRFPLSE